MGNMRAINITVSNAAGNPVLVQHLKLKNPDAAFTISGLDKLPNGAYLITITWDDGKTITKQFTKR